jgi:hypothetical protein
MVAIQAMMPWHGRFKFYLMDSVEAAESLPVWVNPRFIYIDANHRYDRVRTDIDVWWRRLPEGGILAGHDYDDEHKGVVRAVNEFSETWGVKIRLTYGDAPDPVSWYAYKGEPEEFKELFV